MIACVVVPTYDEAGTIEGVVREVRALPGGFSVLVVDDASPDGTGGIADRIASADPGVSVLHRPRKEGLGAAYRAGLAWAVDRGSEVVFQIDADFSHDPKDLVRLREALESGADLAVGSRYRPGGRVVHWSGARRALSRGATWYANLVTGMGRGGVTDATAGIAGYRRRLLESIALQRIASTGYAFQIEMKYRAWRGGFRIAEVPITFTERRAGRSKLGAGDILEAIWIPWWLRLA